MNGDNSNQERPQNQPDYLAWNVTLCGEKVFWRRLGTVWKHIDRRSYTFQLETCPINSQIVLPLPLEYAPQSANEAGRS